MHYSGVSTGLETGTGNSHSHSHRLHRTSSSQSWSTAFSPDLDMLLVENAATTAACSINHDHRHRRIPGLQLNKFGSTASASARSPSSATAAELESGVRSPNGLGGAPLNSLEPSYKIAALEEEHSDLGSDMTSMSYSDSTSTSTLATPTRASSPSPDTPTITTPDNSLMLHGIMSPGLTSISLLDAVASCAVEATEKRGLSDLCPPSLTSSSTSSASSTSGSSEHSSYSATHRSSKKPSSDLTSATSTPEDASRRGIKRSDAESPSPPSAATPTPTPTPTSTSTCTSTPTSTALRPLGPAHLEHDYHLAHKSLSHALAIASYELFGFSIPVRSDAIEARRPGRDAIPLLRHHPLVRRAARAVDRADGALEGALARGETFENTPVPEEWRWGSEYLRPYEWARLEPECVVKKERGARSTVRGQEEEVSESGGGLRTRAQKRKAACEVDGREVCDEGGSSSSSSSAPAASSSMPSIPPSSSSTMTTATDPSITPTLEKRKRGRPRKHPLNPPSCATQPPIQIQIQTIAVNYTSATDSPTRADADPAVRRRRGRPRKNNFSPALPSSGTGPAHVLRPTKRRRVEVS